MPMRRSPGSLTPTDLVAMNAQLNIYTPLGQDGYELCHPVRANDFETIAVATGGTPRHGGWKQIPVTLIRNDETQNLVESDSPWLGSHALIFRARAVKSMGKVLSDFGELLHLACSEANVWVYNAARLVDALDESASSVRRFKDGRIMMVERYVFRAAAVRGIDAFKIPHLRVSPTFLSQRFVDRWNESGLKGLEFKQVWASPN